MKHAVIAILLATAGIAFAQNPTTAPTSVPAAEPTSAPTSVPATEPTSAPAKLPATLESVPTSAPSTMPTTLPATGSASPSRQPSLVNIVRAKNIFSKDRQPPRRWNGNSGRPSYTPSRPRLPVLVGVARDESDLVAVIELPDERRVIQLRPGDSLPNNAGILQRITLDQIDVAAAPGAATRPIRVGQDLQGAAPEPATGPTTATSGSSTMPTGSIDGDDPLSRMRRRRMQEMNR